MEIKLNNKTLEISKGDNKFCLREPLDPKCAVAEIINGKSSLTYSMSEIELRALYEVLKRRFNE